MHTAVLSDYAKVLSSYYKKHFPALFPLTENAFLNTIQTTVQPQKDGTTFVITGDIPAMWLRDSSAQLVNYIPFAKDSPEVRTILEGAMEKQARLICLDPYANAFNAAPNGNGFQDETQRNPNVWERKFEVDSLCAPLFLLHEYWKRTRFSTVFSDTVHEMIRCVAATFLREQRHETSEYSFQRLNCPETDTLPCHGRGTPVSYTGMVWSGFRPSDDRCEYGYLIPANMMAVQALKKAAEIASVIYRDASLAETCIRLAGEIENGILKYGIVDTPDFGKILAYETDGFGHYLLMDDANSPSLLSLPYLGAVLPSDPLYQNTRKFILSGSNPYYYEGACARGIGSPHTPRGYVWHIAIIMQALTSTEPAEILQCLSMLADTTAGTNFMHESFDPDCPQKYTRPWFAWANTLLAQLQIKLMQESFFD